MSPSGNDAVTIPCPVCATPFVAAGKRRYCRDACRVTAHRRRARAEQTSPPAPPASAPRRPVTVYQCDGCDTRALGVQRCEACGTFMRRVGPGGHCPGCDEPVAYDELQQP